MFAVRRTVWAKLTGPLSSFSTKAGAVQDQVAVVTGSGFGIGRSIAQRLANEGAKVVVSDFNEKSGQETVRLIKQSGGEAVFQFCDATKEADIAALMARASSEYGALNILVNNAVRFIFGHLGGAGHGSGTGTDKAISDADWENTFNNVVGYARCIEHAVPLMRRNELTPLVFDNDQGEGVTRIHAGSRGAVVNIASVSSYIAQPEFLPYNCAKGAVLQLTKCSAMDLAKDKIRVNAVCPGTIETPGSYGHMRLVGLDLEEGRKVFGDSCLLKRQAAPEEIAAGVCFLASDQASFMTGAHIVMDGGGTI